jgi:proline racemase
MAWQSTAYNWTPPEGGMLIKTIEAHTGGEPFRVIIDGFPELPGATMLERRRYAKQHFDHLRRALMWEPRGHADMYGGIVTPPVTAGADLGVLFTHNEGFSTMCGHGVIALATVAVEVGLVPRLEPETRIYIDTPAGLVKAYALIDNGRVRSVRFHNVPSFVVAFNRTVNTQDWGRVHYDLAFGGAFYAYVDAAPLGLRCIPEDYQRLVEAGRAIKRAVAGSRKIEHPFESDLGFLYGVIFSEPAADARLRNVCVFADGEVDRSPTGTGVSGRLAIEHARGEIATGEAIVIESIVGSRFTGRVVETARCGPYAAVIPEVEGAARILGRSEFLFDPEDEIGRGFLLR